MTGLRVGSLFTGYGGLDSAVREVLGGDLAWVSDNHPSAVALLAHHHPDVPNLGDITAIDWATVPPVDVLAGGFPCTDLSAAGKREGLRPGTRSGLWSHMADAIGALRPALVVAENVRGLCSASAHSDLEPCPWCVGDDEGVPLRALGAVLGDLADLGYDAQWCGLRASDVGAPHGRYRIFLVAWPAADAAGFGHGHARQARVGGVQAAAVAGGEREAAGDAGVLGRDAAPAARRGGQPAGTPGGPGVAAADTAGPRRGQPRGITPGPAQGAELEAIGTVGRGGSAPVASDADRGGLGPVQRDVRAGQLDADRGTAPDTDGAREQQRERHVADLAGRADDGAAAGVDWREYAPAVHRWERILGRPAPEPTVAGRRGTRVLNAAFVEWLMGLPEGHVTGVPGLSRSDQLRLLGNGVVPQQGAAALRLLLSSRLAAAVA